LLSSLRHDFSDARAMPSISRLGRTGGRFTGADWEMAPDIGLAIWAQNRTTLVVPVEF
jgi:hypothetical protein